MKRHSSAPGKLIFCGEHAVVYDRPGIALPMSSIRAYATVATGSRGGGVRFVASDLDRKWKMAKDPDHPFSQLAMNVLKDAGLTAEPDVRIFIHSDIPISGGMGSSAAIATAIVRALAAYINHDLPNANVSAMVFNCERRYHGLPSGIDNTVVAYERPIWFIRRIKHPDDQIPDIIQNVFRPVMIYHPFTIVIGDTGVRVPTQQVVEEVRQRHDADPQRYEAIFDAIGDLVKPIKASLANGNAKLLGQQMNATQEQLELLGVSSPELERLIAAARNAGAYGAKLTGGGRGGVMFALVKPDEAEAVKAALEEAGAVRAMISAIAVRK